MLSVCYTWCMLYSMSAVLGLCSTRCMRYSVYVVHCVCYTRCVMYSVYAALGVMLYSVLTHNHCMER